MIIPLSQPANIPMTLPAMARRRRTNFWPNEAVKLNRIRLWRDLRKLTQKQLADMSGMDQSQIARLESGKSLLRMDKAAQLARPLEVAPTDLLPDAPISIAIRYNVRAHFSERDAPPECAAPQERLAAPPRLARPEQCFAAEIVDDSANRLYPRGSFLIVRPLEYLNGGPLKNGDRVLVAHYVGSPRDGNIGEVLVGELAQSLVGDLMVQLRSTNKAVPHALYLRQIAAPSLAAAVGDHPMAYQPEHIVYAPQRDDPVIILGRVERVIAPI